MNAYFFKMTNEEKDNILDQHKTIYDGYVTSYAQPAKEQPLYTQSYANDKGGINVNNRGEVSTYSNLRINEMRHDGKSTGLFQDEESVVNEGDMKGKKCTKCKKGTYKETSQMDDLRGVVHCDKCDDETKRYVNESVVNESEDKDDDYYVSLGEQLDMIGDGDDDLEHGTFEDDDSDMVLVSPEVNFDDDDEFMDYDEDELVFNLGDKIFDDEDEIDDEEVDGLFDDLRESLDMFKRFTKYN